MQIYLSRNVFVWKIALSNFTLCFSGINIVIIFTAAKPRRKGMVIMMELQLQPLAAEGNGLLAPGPWVAP